MTAIQQLIKAHGERVGDKTVFECPKYSGYPAHMETFKAGHDSLAPLLKMACAALLVAVRSFDNGENEIEARQFAADILAEIKKELAK